MNSHPELGRTSIRSRSELTGGELMFSGSEESTPPEWLDDALARQLEREASASSDGRIAVCGISRPALWPQVLVRTRFPPSRTSIDAAGHVRDVEPEFDGWEEIELFYGDAFSAAGPAITVRNRLVRVVRRRELDKLLAKDRDRMFDLLGIDEPDPAGPPVRSTAAIVIDGKAHAVEVLDGDGVWAAVAAIPVPSFDLTLEVSIVGRGVARDDVRCVWLRDLGPLQSASEAWKTEVREARERIDRATDHSVPHGEAAVRALIDHVVLSRQSSLLQRRSAHRLGNSPRSRAGLYHALWQAAVDHQAQMWGIDRGLANEQITSMVNHLGRLDEQTDWFSDSPDLRDAAIIETMAYVTRGESVASAPAQRAWVHMWEMEIDPDSDIAANMKRFVDERDIRRAPWMELWTEWFHQRRRLP